MSTAGFNANLNRDFATYYLLLTHIRSRRRSRSRSRSSRRGSGSGSGSVSATYWQRFPQVLTRPR